MKSEYKVSSWALDLLLVWPFLELCRVENLPDGKVYRIESLPDGACRMASLLYLLTCNEPMEAAHNPFKTANYLLHKASHAQWHRQQSKEHILRSQLGFKDRSLGRPKVCEGCMHYHGVAYGYSRANRTMLICGFHPYGWQTDTNCPDWSGLSLSDPVHA